MIALTRLNGSPLYVNSDLIKWVEAAPDTLLTLVNGEKLVVRESCEDLVERVQAHRVLLLNSLAKLMPEPEDLLRNAAAASIPGPWSRSSPGIRTERPASGSSHSDIGDSIETG